MRQNILLRVLVSVSIANFVFVVTYDAWALRAVNRLFGVSAPIPRSKTKASAGTDVKRCRTSATAENGPSFGPILVNDDIQSWERGYDHRVGRVDNGPRNRVGKGPWMRLVSRR
jgi:hypothetical protein